MRGVHGSVASLAAVLSMAAAGASCGYFDTPTGANAPAIGLRVALAADSVAQGDSVTVMATVSRINGYGGSVALAVTGAPAGITSTIVNSSPTADSATSLITLAVAATTDTGSYTITVRATGSGSTDTTVTSGIQLTVTSAVPPSYYMYTGAAAVSIAQGTATTTSVVVSRTNFAGTVTLTAENLPAGVTASFAPAALKASSSTLTLTAAPTATAGNYTITIRGTATGLADVTTTLGVTVNPATLSSWTTALNTLSDSIPPGGSGAVTLTFARVNFTGAIALEAENLPDSVDAAFAPNPAPAGTSILTLTASAAALPGVYKITIRGSVPGLTDVTSTLTLVVKGD